MRKAPWILGATLLGLGGLLAFDQHQFGDPFALHSAGSGLKLPIKVTTAAAPTTTEAAPATTDQTQPTQTQPVKEKRRRAVGAVVPNPYGAVQVRVTARGGAITGITFLQLPYGDPTSQSISDQVAPVLAQQALDAQSANVAGVSGATYTSDAYRQSLQSALDKLGIGK